jgi:hypothetical protein
MVAGLPVVAPPDPTAKFRRRRGHNHDEGLGHCERAQASTGRHSGLSRGHDIGAEAPEGTIYNGGARRWGTSTPASDCACTGAGNGKSETWGAGLP